MTEWEEGTKVNYLDVSFDMTKNSYKPYMKKMH